MLLAIAIYVNFFSHHFLPDMRWLLFAWTLLLFGRVRIYFTVDRVQRWMPLIVAGAADGLLPVGGGECRHGDRNMALSRRAHGWQLVSLQKLGSWYLLLIISFVLVTIVNRPRPPDPAPSAASDGAGATRAHRRGEWRVIFEAFEGADPWT